MRKSKLRHRYGRAKLPRYYRYYIRVGGSILRRGDGTKVWYASPGSASTAAKRLGGKVDTYSHDRRPT